jgi:hypothetical protein
MRVRLLLVPAVVLAIAYSCGGSGDFTGTGTGIGAGNNPGDAATRVDAGNADAGDAGVDAGCNTQIVPVGPLFANDNCVQLGGTTPATATITQDAGCSNVRIALTTGFNCVGSLAGPANAFTGTCGGPNPCTSTSLPGTLNCTVQLNTAACTIQVCANAAGTICP